jgi:zinc transport system substrate-binding protein
VLAAAVALGAVLAAGGCGTGTAAPEGTPTIHVVTGLFPLAQAVQRIGGSTVDVTDVVPAGADPRTYQLSPAQVDAVRGAALVVEVGALQPSLDAAGAGTHSVLDVQARLGTPDPYVWLDPGLMTRAVTLIGTALAAANPAAASVYRKDVEGYAAEIASTGIDYESTLSTCPRRTIVTADDAFAAAARQYGLTDVVTGAAADPNPAQVGVDVKRVSAADLTTVFSEPFVPTDTIDAVAAAAHVKVRVLDPLTGPPAGGWPDHADYVQLMEANLGALSNALGCANTENGM